MRVLSAIHSLPRLAFYFDVIRGTRVSISYRRVTIRQIWIESVGEEVRELVKIKMYTASYRMNI